MKRSLIIAGLLSVTLLLCAACGQEAPEQEPQPAPTQEQPAAPAPQPEPPAPAEEKVVSEPQPELPVYPIQSGIWLAENDVGYSNYYYFNGEEQSGHFVNLEYGLGMPFSYAGSGNELVFLLGDDAMAYSAVLHTVNEDDEQSANFTLEWTDALPETLTYVSADTLEEFHFFSNDQLGQMALEQYTLTSDSAPSQYGTMTNEDNTVTVQLYDNLGEHNSTSAWYIVDRFTGAGTDLLTGEAVDLLAGQEDPLPEEDAPTQDQELPAEGEELPAGDVQPSPEEETPEMEEPPQDTSAEELPESEIA